MNDSMNLILYEQAKQFTKTHEGYNECLYIDPRGYISGGWGHCLDSSRPYNSMREFWEEIFNRDFYEAIDNAIIFISMFNLHHLSMPRRLVIIDMCYNMGSKKLKKFEKMIAALQTEDYETAATEMEDSDWYLQTGNRARRLVKTMRTGMYPVYPKGAL